MEKVMAMEWGGERNLALRKALGLKDGEIGLVNQGDVVQVVVADRPRAKEMHDVLGEALTNVSYMRRQDGRWLVTAYEDQAADARR